MRNWWIRFGCFLTGYNYNIVYNSSEVSAKAVKKYTSAMVIVCILWSFVGFTFTQRYLKGDLIGCILGAFVAVIVIVQIERQIILTIEKTYGLLIFRACLALMMSLIGAAIIDQIILKEDIELAKITYNDKKVDSLMPARTAELRSQIHALDSTIITKETERNRLIDDVAKRPLIPNVTMQTQSIPVPTQFTDSNGAIHTKIVMKPSNSVLRSNTLNPNQALIGPLDSVIGLMRDQKAIKEKDLLNIRPELLAEIKKKTGFLDELKVMFILISNSSVALCFWLLWVLFLLFIEMLVLFSKMGDKSNDYDMTVKHQMELQKRKLNAMASLGAN